MAEPKHLVKYGVSNFEYGILGTNDLVATTKKVPGLSEVKLDIKTDKKNIKADNESYVDLYAGIQEATEQISIYDINPEMGTDFFGIEKIKGVQLYDQDIRPNEVATLFRTELSDGSHMWVGMLKGTFVLPSNTYKTVENTPDADPESSEGSFLPRSVGDDKKRVLLVARDSDPDFDFDTFHKWVFPKTVDEARIKTSPQNEQNS